MLKKSDVINIYGLSPMQEGMLFHSVLDRNSSAYFEQFLITLQGNIDLDIFKETFNRLIRKYDVLRTVFTYKKTQKPRQVLLKSRTGTVFFNDVSQKRQQERSAELDSFLLADRRLGFDLSKDMLMRISIFKTGDDTYELVWSFHHIIMDGWCFGILFTDFVAIYGTLLKRKPEKNRPAIPYRRYIDWLERQDRQAGMAYWKHFLEGYDRLASLPRLNAPPQAEASKYETAELKLEWDRRLSDKLIKLAGRYQVTPNTLFQCLWGILLHRYNNCEDAVFGAVVSGRPADIDGVERMVGLFINTVPVRIKETVPQRFPDLLTQVQQQMLQSKPYEYLPLAEIQSHSPLKGMLLDHILVFENYPLEQQAARASGEDVGFLIRDMKIYEQTNYDFNLVVARADCLQLRCVFNATVFGTDLIKRTLTHFQNTARQVALNPGIRPGNIEILNPRERRQILYEFNDTAVAFSLDEPVHHLFEQEAANRSGTVAIVGADPSSEEGVIMPIPDIDTHVTYGELNRRAGCLADYLRSGGVSAGEVVGLCTYRSVEMMVGIMGILKSGAAYLPLDPDSPPLRIVYMLQDSSAEVIVADGSWQWPGPASAEPERVVDIGVIDGIADPSHTNRGRATGDAVESRLTNLKSDSLKPVYVVYTSGSTGRPKGVVIGRRQLLNYLFGLRRQLGPALSHCHRFATLSTISADLGNTVIYAALCFGGCLHIVPPNIIADGGRLAACLARLTLDCLKITPSHMAALIHVGAPERLLPRHLLIFGGEALDSSLISHLKQINDGVEDDRSGCEIINHYGPSETCIGVTTCKIDRLSPLPVSIPIGKPLPNSRGYILDDRRQPVPAGVAGELHIGGSSLASGYLNNPELTADKFIFTSDSPIKRGGPKGRGVLSHERGARIPKSQILYKTGDLCRLLPDGNIQFLGRQDHQVKIRGFRVETAEVEQCLKSLPFINDAAVLMKPESSREPQLTAYIVADPRSLPVVNGYTRYRLPNHLAVAQLNKNETDYIYKEIFQLRAYTRFGITLDDGDCIMDVGANIGLFSLFIRTLYRNSQIYAFEPNPLVFDILKTNAAIYLPEVKLFDCGLSDRLGEKNFTFFEGFSLLSGLYTDTETERELVKRYMMNEDPAGIADHADELLEGRFRTRTFTVKLDTLSNIMQQESILRVDLLKINVEKAELDVLRGIASRDWGKIRQIVLEVDVPKNLDTITAMLEDHGFQWLVDRDVRLTGTPLCYVYAVKSSGNNTLIRKKRDYARPLPCWDDNLLTDDRLRELLAARLPDFMIPVHFIRLAQLPLTANGKLDRRALPQPDIKSGAGFTSPRHQVEKDLAAIWADVLGLEKDRIGIDHNFFDLGGHSLRATILVARLNKHFSIDFPLRKIFDGPTIRQLARVIQHQAAIYYKVIKPQEKREYYPLSSAQKRLFFLEQLENIGTSYQIFSSLKIEGELDKKRLETAFRELMRRHETLRTSFEFVAGEPVQRVHDEVDFKIEYSDLASSDHSSGSMNSLIENFIRPYDLARPPLLRVGVVEAGHPSQEGTYVLMLDMHHIISDGTSLGILHQEMVGLYGGEALPPLRVQYRDFSTWQRQLHEDGIIRRQEEYWLDLYSREVPQLILPCDYPRPDTLSFRGDDYLFSLSADTTRLLLQLNRQFEVTLYMTLMAVFNVLLYKYSGLQDVVVGSAVLGRPHFDLERIIGMFVNSLAIRNQPCGDKIFADFLTEVKENSIKAFENQEVQFEEVVERLKLKRDPSRNPLFDVMFVVQNFEQPRVQVGNVTFVPWRKEDKTSKFDLVLFAYEVKDEIHFKLEYCTALFKRSTMGRLAGHFLNIAGQVGTRPQMEISEINILTPEENRRLVMDLNQLISGSPAEQTLPQLFARQVECTPHRVALVTDDDGRHLSYLELAREARQLARFLYNEQGVSPDQGIGILMDRSAGLIVAILGILQAGGGYIPIDPTYPEIRIKHIVDDAALGLLISQKKYLRTLNRLQWECASLHTFLCPDSSDIHQEVEVERSELMEMKLWEYVGERADNDITGGGWLNSYTGKPFTRAEMEEYGENILNKLTPLLHPHRRVLEVGCGSGISMFRLAPKVGFYCGCDLSPSIIEKNRQRVVEEGHKNIRLFSLAAHEIDQLEEDNFDLVIFNSVIQCFHGHNYLRRVLIKVLSRMGRRGYLFIGDIMDQDLKPALVADLRRFQQVSRDQGVSIKTDWSAELFVSRRYFLDLAVDIPEIVDKEFSPKIFTLENELTRFRYDALLTVDKVQRSTRRREFGSKYKYQLDRRALERHRSDCSDLSAVAIRPYHMAYIIYTSGSTGRPKGTMTTHANVVRVVRNSNYIHITPADRILQLSNYAFDGSIFDIFGALLNGAALVLLKRGDVPATALDQLADILLREQITVFFLTTALFNTLVDLRPEALGKVRQVLFGGERVSVDHASRALKYLGPGRIIHVYGPTETTVFATFFPIEHIREGESTIPIGTPLAETWTLILDRDGHPLPFGLPGELYVGGSGVARGYLNRPESTAENFIYTTNSPLERGAPKSRGVLYSQIPDPKSRILYRTGDLCRRLSTGIIEFIGRVDRQVKIRGFRIEPGEIEDRLLKHPGIRESVIVAREAEGERYLCAYVVLLSGPSEGSVKISGLSHFLSRFLPEYMIPRYFTVLERIPLNLSGKVDHPALPEPELAVPEGFIPPAGPVEERLATIWSEILALPRGKISTRADFFQLGGHSLKATVLSSRVHQAFNVKLPLAEVFRTPSIQKLAAYIRKASTVQGVCQRVFSAVVPIEDREYYPLSSSQKRLFVLQEMNREETGYNMPAVLSLQGVVSQKRLTDAFEKLICRHQSLRTSFRIVKDKPVQTVHRQIDSQIKYYDLSESVIENSKHTVERTMFSSVGADFFRPFDLSRAPLFRVGVLRRKNNGKSPAGGTDSAAYLLVDMHHIVSDGISLGILVRDFMILYGKGRLPDLKVQYKDFSLWQNRLLGSAEMAVQQAYWLSRCSGDIPVLQLPQDYPRPAVQCFEGDEVRFRLDRIHTAGLRSLNRQADTTLFMVLLTFYNILLAKLSGQEEILVGTPVGGRRHADLESIIGMFVNTLVLRSWPAPDKPVGEFLAEVKSAAIEAFENQDYPFEELVDRLAVRRDVSRNPLFDVMLSLQNVEIPEMSLPGLKLDPCGYGNKISLFDMTLTIIEGEDEIFMIIEYSVHLFKRETIERFAGYFQKIVRAVIENPGTRISEITILSTLEIGELLYQLNDTGSPYPVEKTLHHLFRDQAGQTPDYGAVALADRWLSYGELDRRSDQLAANLGVKGLRPGDIVGLNLERSLEMIIAILAVLKSGSAYLPLDPDDPPGRINYIVKDSNVAALLTTKSIAMGIADSVKSIDPLLRGVLEGRGVYPLSNVVSDTRSMLAYVIYTSGSTGRPKGVLVEHRSAVNLALCQKRRFSIDATDHILQFSAYSFDASVEQIFITLFSGALLVLIDKDTLLEQGRFNQYLTEHQVTHLHAVPFFLQNMNLQQMGSLRRIIAGGDACPLPLAQKLCRGVNFYNEYGPTETTVTSVEFKIERVDDTWSRLPIGRPIDNTRIFILDWGGRPLPYGVTAEICIGGDGVARGYLNNPELTADKFIFTNNSPLERGGPKGRGVLSPQILYRTGDLGRWLPDGNLEFLGRMDHQIKIRGFRIELAEIECLLIKHQSVRNAVVIQQQAGRGEMYLVAYIIPSSPQTTEDSKGTITNTTGLASRLRRYLSTSLPDYMIPAHVVILDCFPMTRSGKIDRKRLPEPIMAGRYIPPGHELEKNLVKIWSEVLGKDSKIIGIDQSFFTLGGHSLKATILASKIHKTLQVKIPLVEIFRSPTIRQLSAYIKSTAVYKYASIKPVEKREYYVLSPAQKRLYVLHQMASDKINYNMPYRFYLAADLEVERLEPAFETLIKRHESLRTSYGVVGEEPVQRVHDSVDFQIEFYNLAARKRKGIRTPPFGYTSQELTHPVPSGHPSQEGIIREFIRPFDLSRPPLLRVGLVRGHPSQELTHPVPSGHSSQEGTYVLMLDMHHIITDGTSHSILKQEFMSLMEGKDLPGLRLQYKDYAQWLNSYEQQIQVIRQESYWLRQFAGEIPVLNLPGDYPRPLMQSFEGRSVNFGLGTDETGILRRLETRVGATIYMSLLAVFNILLSKLSGQEDVVVGTPVAARRHSDLEKIVGMFVNTLAIRNAPAGHKLFTEFLEEVKGRTLAAFENQEYPFENLVDKVAVQRDTSRNPLFDVMLNLINQSDYGEELPHPEEMVDIKRYDHIEGSSKFDLNWSVIEVEQVLLVNVEYSSRLFKPATIERLIRYFKQIVAALGRNDTIKLSQIDMISAGEKRQILYEFNQLGGGDTDEGAGRTIARLFDARQVRCPDTTALVYQGSQVTYKELNERSSQLANRLTAKRVGPDVVVGLMGERSLEMVIAILGILQAGAAYLPIDSGYPPERIRYMLEDSGASIIVNGSEGRLSIEEQNSGLDRGSCTMGRASSPLNLVYVIYTSGSSGRPKGVMLAQKSVINLIQYQYCHTNIEFNRVLQFNTISFDVSFQEIFSTLVYGGCLVLIPAEILKDIPRLFRLVDVQQIGTLFLPASFLKFIFNEESYVEVFPRRIRHIVTAGEQLIVTDRLKAYLKTRGVFLHNHYGPSESHVVTALTMDPSAHIPGLPSIGRPLKNTGIYIVDRCFHLQPPGLDGELLIGGIQVARGYLNNPELTAEKFVTPPIYSPLERGARRAGCVSPLERGGPEGRGVLYSHLLYRTGDLARWQPDGTIEFRGRIDQQVKIRGFRIEPAEIENLLLKHDSVNEAVVIDREDDKREKYLAAYIVPSSRHANMSGLTGKTIGTNLTNQLRQYLSLSLPDYMVPSYFIMSPRIPLTPNGKVDRRALPKPESPVSKSRTAPRDEIEEKLAFLWSGLLGLERENLGIDDNFFALGGHSLKATVLIARIHKEMEVKVSLAEVFKTPTIRGLADYLRETAVKKFVPIEAAEKRKYYPLSSAQKRMYILQQMEKENTVYNLPIALTLGIELDEAKLALVFRQLVQRHESLRTAFTVVADEPMQCIRDTVDFQIEYYDADNIKEFVRAFDLSKAPLLRVGVVHPSQEGTHTPPFGHPSQEGKYVLMVDMHHIVSDGVSMRLLIEDFQVLQRQEPLPRLRIQYKDYALWQNCQLLKERNNRRERYWLSLFADEIPVLTLPYDCPRPPLQRFEGDSLGFTIDALETEGLKNLASAQGVTLFMLLLTLFNILLSKLGGQEDIVVGTSVAGRRHADLERIVGMFVNTLALRNMPVGNKDFLEFLAEVKGGALGAFENQEYPFEDLVESLSVSRQTGRNPLFDVMLALQNTGENSVEQSGTIDFENPVSRFDMTWNGFEGEGKLFFFIEFCSFLFRKETVERFVDYFSRIIAQVLAESGIKLSAIEILSPEERKQVLFDFNDTASSYPRHKTIPELFADQVLRLPDRIAVLFEDRCLSYCSLNLEANRLAIDLHDRGVRADTPVAITGRRSVEMMVNLLGILKAGGLYVPVDPEYPEDRVRYMLADSGAGIVVTDSKVRRAVGKKKTAMDRVSGFIGRLPSPLNLAYIIYTSGSTGKPRGVMVNHCGVVRLVKNTNYVELTAGQRLLPTGALEFDASTFEIWGSLLNGLTLCLLSEAEILSPGRLKERLYRYDIDIIWLTSPLFNQLLDADEELFGRLDYLLVGGDVVSTVHINKLRARYPKLKIINGYGPTENTTFSTTFLLERDYREPVPIGRPIANSTAYILDRHRRPLPVGVVGELWVGGDGVARGYLNNPELTAEKFVTAPAASPQLQAAPSHFTVPMDSPLERGGPKGRDVLYSHLLYRTGDLARWQPDGTIEFRGRIDQQVKIRGFRIEPVEIESRLLRHSHVREAVVVAGEDDRKGKYLAAYIVPKTDESGNTGKAKETNITSSLREYLSLSLPDYMIPAYFVELENIPLTPRGKIDRRRLPAPGIKAFNSYAPPQNRIERLLLTIWSRVLGIKEKEIGVNDDFFELGGHSLKAAMMAAKLQKEFGLVMPLLEIFKSPTIRILAGVVHSRRLAKFLAPSKTQNLVLLKQGSATGRHIFFIHAGSGEVEVYLELCRRMAADANCWGIQADRSWRYSPRNLTIEKVAAGYVEGVKRVQPRGPYNIAGWCIGGTIAFEMVNQLETRGEAVELLALISSSPPRPELTALVKPFSLKSELGLVCSHLPDFLHNEDFKGRGGIKRLWRAVAVYLEEHPRQAGHLRRSIPPAWSRAIPGDEHLEAGPLLHFLNVIRTFDRARQQYVPGQKVKAPVCFFSAAQEEIPGKNLWSRHSDQPLNCFTVGGHHFSLFQTPHVRGLAGKFNQLLAESV